MIALKVIALVIKIAVNRFLDFASLAVRGLRWSQYRSAVGLASAMLFLVGLFFFILSLIGIIQGGMWFILTALLSLVWMALWAAATYLAGTSPTWPPER